MQSLFINHKGKHTLRLVFGSLQTLLLTDNYTLHYHAYADGRILWYYIITKFATKFLDFYRMIRANIRENKYKLRSIFV